MDAKTITVEGEVRHEVMAPGSKSERKAVVLTMHSGKKYVLQHDRAIHSRTRRWTSSSAIRLRPKDWHQWRSDYAQLEDDGLATL